MRVGIIGAGAWGTTIGIHLADMGHEVRLWAREEDEPEKMEQARENERFLPSFRFPDGLHVTGEALGTCDLLVGAVPTQHSRSVLDRLKDSLPNAPFVSLSKGIEIATGKLPTQIYGEVMGAGRPSAVLTGPCIAREVARGLPTAVVVAGDEADMLQQVFNTGRLRVYTSDDKLGAELCSALKNVLAIAAGITDGMELGDNTKASLLTRGVVEITRLGTALGAKAMTFTGLAGFGDLFTTCVSPHGRNRGVGERIGRGEKVDDILSSMTSVAEGVPTTKAVMELAREHKVVMPITTTMHAILFEGVSLEDALGSLMKRARRPEN
ncbi:MAG: NAD(P)H-dependent glycerol-3-phosphate dehydrogenase [Planctomycetota bacterium]|jgi:glycerol-3-phosphate dehydrogenase (NAD(P)+)